MSLPQQQYPEALNNTVVPRMKAPSSFSEFRTTKIISFLLHYTQVLNEHNYYLELKTLHYSVIQLHETEIRGPFSLGN